MRFWRIEVPFAMPALIWNMMMSHVGRLVLCGRSAEAISVGNTTIALPGHRFLHRRSRSQQKNLARSCWAIATMLVVILIYDQIVFRPLVAWADRFRVEQEPSAKSSVILGSSIDDMRRSRVAAHRRDPSHWRNVARRDAAAAGARPSAV